MDRPDLNGEVGVIENEKVAKRFANPSQLERGRHS